MKRVWLAGLVLAGATSGCGGGGGGGSTVPPNPLIGMYSGNGTASDTKDTVRADIGVASNSTLCGSISDPNAKTKALVGALVSNTGVVSNGSIEIDDSNGKKLATGSLSGQITGAAGPANASATLTATTDTATITYSFQSLQNVTAAAAKARRRRRLKKQLARKTAITSG